MQNAKSILILVLGSVLLVPSLFAHTSQIGLGLRGGGQMYVPSTNNEIKSNMGWVGGMDLRYTFYSPVTGEVDLGFVVGAGVGYGSTSIKGTNTDQYTNYDYLANRMDYTIDAKYRQTDKFFQANASLLFAFRYGGLSVNLGPRFMLPFASSSSFTVNEAHINVYYPKYEVSVVDKLITGVLETPYTSHITHHTLPRYSVLLGVEIGYEWDITDKFNAGVQLYADVSVWNSKLAIPSNPLPMIEVAPITDASNPVPMVTVNPISGQISSMRYLDFGVRAFISISVAKDSEYRYYYNARHDTRKHRNRYLWW